MKYFFFFILLLSLHKADAQRIVLPMNENWEFTKDIYSIENNSVRAATWQHVALPHTWNITDVMDDVPGYFRGVGTYRKKFLAEKEWVNKDVYLFIEGANQSTAVYVNGKITGTHTGGYTAFYVPLSQYIVAGKQNELIIQVDNSHNPAIPPLTADFTFYGGLYRQVSLITVNPVHFSFNEMGSKAVFISTPDVSEENAVVNIRSIITGDNNSPKLILSTILYDAKNNAIAKTSETIFTERQDKSFTQNLKITRPKLWSPETPYLYKAITRITDAGTGLVLDEIKTPVGFRWFRFDGKEGFFLNGKPLKLMGASRHQDREGMGNAVSKELARKDVESLKEMGGNFLRIAHYPQDAAVMQACDELGILTSVEIPLVNEITETDSFYNNSMRMQQEMIRQYYNHPSVVIWCYMNEILLRPQFNNDKERQTRYFNNITTLAKKLDSLTRAEDPYRYTMMANHGAYNRYRENGMLDISMIVGWNLYAGWYGADMKGFPAFLDQFHKDYPATPILVTEYGADADPRIRSIKPVRFDKSVEYSTRFHQYYFDEMMRRPFVGGGMVWNLADFNSETRNESMPHINNKGLLEWNRKPKDPYYFYKAALSSKPFIKILGTSANAGIADSGSNIIHRQLQVANNFDSVMLFVNGKRLETHFTDQSIAEWNIAVKNGINIIEAKASTNGKRYSDKLSVDFSLQPSLLTDTVNRFRKLNVLLGADRYFTDDKNEIWIPAQQYQKGGWGYIGGKPLKLSSGNLPYGTDKNILGTFNDPVYQTQQAGLSAFRLDVPAGEYEITLHFAELVGGTVQQLVYNLDSTARTEQKVKRIFDVAVNGKPIFEKLNIEQQYGIAVALHKTIKLSVNNNEGINITFAAVEGEPILNAIQVKKLIHKNIKTKIR